MWDVPTGKAVETLNHTRAVHAVGVAPGGGGPVAFGGTEGALRLWDPRAPRGEDLVSPWHRVVSSAPSPSGWRCVAALWHPILLHLVAPVEVLPGRHELVVCKHHAAVHQ